MTSSNHSSAELLKICEEITIDLRNSPGSALFNEPVNRKEPRFDNYFKIIKNPQDLGTILSRLQKNEYTSVQQWDKDINTIWSNAETYNGKDSYATIIAHHMSKKCQKLKQRLEIKKISGWMKRLYALRDKIDNILSSPPRGIGLEFAPPPPEKEPAYEKFTGKEMDCLIEASRAFYKPDDLLQMTKILKSDPNIETEIDDVVVNLDSVIPKTLHQLRDFFKHRMAAAGQEYPT